MFETIETWDQELFLFLNGLHVDWLDLPMYLISFPPFWIIVYIYFFYLCFKKWGKTKNFVIVILAIGVNIACTDLITTRLFKHQIKRYRPSRNLVIGPQTHCVENFKGEEYRGGLYGFVSGHSATYFGIATFFFLMLGRKKKHRWFFVWAALIAYSRIYLGVHYPGDIICGAIVGISFTFLLVSLLKRHQPFNFQFSP